MKYSWLFILALFSTLSLAQSASDADVVKAFRLAYQGELTDGPLVHSLERRFREKRSLKDQITCAYLLTFSPRRLLQEPRRTFVAFVLDHSESKEVVEPEALNRLYRMRADESYEEGKFESALSDLKEILKSNNPQMRDYAILKIGWTNLNHKHPESAFAFWLEQVEMALSKKAPISNNLVHGLGLALVEHTKRTDSDVSRVGKLELDAALKSHVALGVGEGLDTLTKEEEIVAFASQLKNFSWNMELVKTVLESSKVTGAKACRYLPFVNFAGAQTTWGMASRVIEACGQWATHSTKDKLAIATLPRLEKLVGGFTLNGSERRVRFEIYQANKHAKLACQEGMAWLSELKTDRKAALVNDIRTNCVAAANEWNNEERAAFIAQLDKVASDGAISKSDDPFLFISTAMIENASVRKALVEAMTTGNASSLGSTLIPSVLAESLKKHKEPASPLLAKFGQQGSGEVRDESVWHELLTEEIASLVAKKDYKEAYARLEKMLPLAKDKKPSADTTELYLSVIVKAKTEKNLESNARGALEKITASGAAKDYTKLTPAILELCGEVGAWDSAWKLLETGSFSKLGSPRFKVALFEAVATGKFTPPQDNKPKNNKEDGELSFIVAIGEATKNHDAKAFQNLKAQGKSPLVADLVLFQAIDKKKAKLLDKSFQSKDRITQVTAWVQFLDSEGRRIGKHAWSNQELFQFTNDSMGEFCSEAKSRLGGMKPGKHKADTAENWATFTQVLSQRLEQCEKRKRS